MGINVGQLVLVIVGGLLTLVATIVATILANRLAMRNSLLVARDQRLFDLRREAVRAVRDATNDAEKLHAIDRTTFTLATWIEVRQKILDPIVNSREAFGLDTRGKEIENLTESFFAILQAQLDENKFRKAIAQFMGHVLFHHDQIQDAWKRTLEQD